jgi:predicted acyltransferase (DUF342 family)
MMFTQSSKSFLFLVLMGAAVSAENNMLRGGNSSPEDSTITEATTPAVVVDSIHHDARTLAYEAPVFDVAGVIDAEFDQGGSCPGTCRPLTPGGSCVYAPDIDVDTTFSPGVHCLSHLSIAGGLTITLKGSSTDMFVFRIATYLVTGADTKFVLDGAEAENIKFYVKNAANIGASSVETDINFKGSIFAGGTTGVGAGAWVDGDLSAQGALTLGVRVKVNGDGDATTMVNGDVSAEGAITFGAKAQASGDVNGIGAITLGVEAKVLSGNINGKGPVTLGAEAIVAGTIHGGAAVTLGASAKVMNTVAANDAIYAVGVVTLGALAEVWNGDVRTAGVVLMGAGAAFKPDGSEHTTIENDPYVVV